MANITSKWFKLFASCQVVKGATKSLVYDLERSAFYDLNNESLEILEMTKQYNIKDLHHIYSISDNILESFFDTLIENELGFYTTEPDSFPEINFSWESPFPLSNSIIELDHFSGFDLKNIIVQLNVIPCRAIQIRILFEMNYNEIKENIISLFDDSRINFIELFIPYSHSVSNNYLIDLMLVNPRLQRIFVYNAPEDKVIETAKEYRGKLIFYFTKDIRTHSEEIIKPERFFTNLNMYTEALQFNLGLNRKVSIDRHGNIKNYLTHSKIFGNITSDPINDIIQKPAFQEKWKISNDKIEKCKICQFRYSCVSNSDIKLENECFYKITTCNFDPEKNVWN